MNRFTLAALFACAFFTGFEVSADAAVGLPAPPIQIITLHD